MLDFLTYMAQEVAMIGEKIAIRRKQLGWSQTELAQRIGIAPSRISEFESGLKTDCNLSTAKRLARALGCSIDYLADTLVTNGLRYGRCRCIHEFVHV